MISALTAVLLEAFTQGAALAVSVFYFGRKITANRGVYERNTSRNP